MHAYFYKVFLGHILQFSSSFWSCAGCWANKFYKLSDLSQCITTSFSHFWLDIKLGFQEGKKRKKREKKSFLFPNNTCMYYYTILDASFGWKWIFIKCFLSKWTVYILQYVQCLRVAHNDWLTISARGQEWMLAWYTQQLCSLALFQLDGHSCS